jgi:hypothetical protein
MNRRDLIKVASLTSGAVGAALSSHRSARAATGGQPFVLVHGAWHGGWCWKRLVPLLQTAARPVHVVTLTGLGERAHLAKSVTGLATHFDDVANLIECEVRARHGEARADRS